MTARPTIAELNDEFRSRLGAPVFGKTIPGRFVWTRGIDALPPEVQIDIWERVRCFSDFTEDNDPYGEHDFGVFVHPDAGKIFCIRPA